MLAKLYLTGAALLALSGCSHIDPQTGSVDRQFGEAVAWNKAVQVVNPDPVYTAEATPPGAHGEKGAAATRRYRTDQVKDVVREQTSTSSTGGGSGPR
jgi:type IV pilus biogenesis protein CpaD/CtpE